MSELIAKKDFLATRTLYPVYVPHGLSISIQMNWNLNYLQSIQVGNSFVNRSSCWMIREFHQFQSSIVMKKLFVMNRRQMLSTLFCLLAFCFTAQFHLCHLRKKVVNNWIQPHACAQELHCLEQEVFETLGVEKSSGPYEISARMLIYISVLLLL